MGAFYVCSVAVLICLAVPPPAAEFRRGMHSARCVRNARRDALCCVLAFGMAPYCGRSFVRTEVWGQGRCIQRYAVQRPFIFAILIRPVSVRE